MKKFFFKVSKFYFIGLIVPCALVFFACDRFKKSETDQKTTAALVEAVPTSVQTDTFFDSFSILQEVSACGCLIFPPGKNLQDNDSGLVIYQEGSNESMQDLAYVKINGEMFNFPVDEADDGKRLLKYADHAGLKKGKTISYVYSIEGYDLQYNWTAVQIHACEALEDGSYPDGCSSVEHDVHIKIKDTNTKTTYNIKAKGYCGC